MGAIYNYRCVFRYDCSASGSRRACFKIRKGRWKIPRVKLSLWPWPSADTPTIDLPEKYARYLRLARVVTWVTLAPLLLVPLSTILYSRDDLWVMGFLLVCSATYWYGYERLFERKYLKGKVLKDKDNDCRAYYIILQSVRLFFFLAFAFFEANLLLRFVSSYNPASSWVAFFVIAQFIFFICWFKLVLDWTRVEKKPGKLSLLWDMLSHIASFLLVLVLAFACFFLGFLGAISDHINTLANTIFYGLIVSALPAISLTIIGWLAKPIKPKVS